jgi:hypothetical protein
VLVDDVVAVVVLVVLLSLEPVLELVVFVSAVAPSLFLLSPLLLLVEELLPLLWSVT